MSENKVGRPTIMTEEVISKLEIAFAMGCSDKEACLLADISHQTLYDYQNLYPEFVERKEMLKETPILQARQTVINSLKDNPMTAMWYLSRKKKDEFTERQEIENTGIKEMDGMRKDVKDLIDYVKAKPAKNTRKPKESLPVSA